MKIAILGATGWIGSTIMKEALERGHQVIAVGRKKPQVSHEALTYNSLDLLDNDPIYDAFDGADVVISAIGGRLNGNHDIVAETAKKLLQALPETSVKRLIWVGGAGSLEVAPGITLLSSPHFPAEYKDEAIAQGEALSAFRGASSTLSWLFVSPAAIIEPGIKTGKYRRTDDKLLVDTQGDSKISVEDYAFALMDELEANTINNARIGFAY